jgi:hypothetical protein
VAFVKALSSAIHLLRELDTSTAKTGGFVGDFLGGFVRFSERF